MATHVRPVAVPWRSPTVQAVLASSFLVVFGVPLVGPALPTVRVAFDLSDAGAGLLITAYTLPAVVLSPLVGMAADAVGRRRVLLPALLGFSLAGGAVAFAPTFPVVLALRLVQGACAAGIFTVTLTLVGDAFDGADRSAILGVNAAVLGVSSALAPLLGGWLVEAGWNVPFLVFFAGVPVAGFVALRLPEPAIEYSAPGLAYLRGAARALPSRPALALYTAAFLLSVAFVGTLFTALPFLLERTYGLPPVWVGAVLTGATLVAAGTSALLGRLAGRFTVRSLIVGSFLGMGASLTVAWFLPTLAGVVLAAVGFGAALGVAFPAIDVAVSGLAPDRYRAGALSLRGSVSALGATGGPLLFTGLARTVAYPTIVAGAGVVLVLAGLVGARVENS
jgi:ACDE family multidrug resistance protein